MLINMRIPWSPVHKTAQNHHKQFHLNNVYGSSIVNRHAVLENLWYELWDVKYLSLSPTCTHAHTQEEACSHFRDFNVRRPNLGNTLLCNTKSLSSVTASTHFIYRCRKDIQAKPKPSHMHCFTISIRCIVYRHLPTCNVACVNSTWNMFLWQCEQRQPHDDQRVW